MSKVVNLNQFRKSKARAEKRAKADENAVTFGLTKDQKARARKNAEAETTKLDQHKIDDSDRDDPET